MEKPGTGRVPAGRRRLLTALCTAMLLAVPLRALEVDVSVSSYEITVGDPVLVEFSVRSAEPGRTNLEGPAVPPSFSLASSRKELRDLGPETGAFPASARTATVISREWIPAEAGEYTIGPFTVVSGAESLSLPPIHLVVRAPRAASPASLRWFPGDGPVVRGVPLVITLMARFAGSPGAVSCAAPENAILESVAKPVRPVNDGWTVLAAWSWTPLFDGLQNLPLAEFEYTSPSGGLSRISTPVQAVSVLPGGIPAAGDSGSRAQRVPKALLDAFVPASAASGAEAGQAGAVPPLPAGFDPASPGPILAAAASFWEKGNVVSALAVLRGAEYRSLFSFRYRKARLAAEESISLVNTLPVPRAAWKPVCLAGALIALAVSLSIRLSRRGGPGRFRNGKRSSRFSAGFALACALPLAVIAAALYASDSKPSAVVAEGPLYHVPEYESTVMERVPAGQGVRVIRTSGDWLYVEAGPSLRGWIPAKNAEIYTKME